MIYENIQGWFNCPTLYKKIADNAQPNDILVEVGCWRGKSSSYMAECLKEQNKNNVEFYCVDHWKGNPHEEVHQNDPSVINDTLYNEFLDNMKPLDGFFQPLRKSSTEAAYMFEDNSISFVYIDAGHEYYEVKSDIDAWLPKVKKGGIIAGDDLHSNHIKKAVRDVFREYSTENSQTWVCYIS